MWTELTFPIVIAHRGDKVHAPENTISAFEMAIRNGADVIEFDVKLTLDGQVVVIHDTTVDRTTNGSGWVSTLPLAALRTFDAGSWFSGQFRDEKIPTLAEVFEAVGKRIFMNVELTNYSTPRDALVPAVVELVKKHGLERRVFFSSFLPRNLHKAGRLLPQAPRGLLTLTGLLGYWGRTLGWRGDYAALNPYFTDVSAAMVRRVHSAGKRLNVWTVNSEAEIKSMISLGVDGIITDDPALALHLLGRGKQI